jgi:hypothetical protein
MLMWRSRAVRPSQVEGLTSGVNGSAECLLRDDGKGSIIVCEQGRAPRHVTEMRLAPLHSAGRCGPEAGPWIFCVGIWTPEDWREELCAWYQYEHGPMLLECPEWQGFRLFETSAARGCQFYVLHRLASRSALDSEQRKRSRTTPWFRRFAKHAWFDIAFERVLCHRLGLLWR